MLWDGRDIDLGYAYPPQAAEKAIQEYVADHPGIYKDGHHLLDAVGVYFRRHHQKYGYPNRKEKYCFVDFEFTFEVEQYESSPDCLSMIGSGIFLDIGIGDNDGQFRSHMDLTNIEQYYAEPEKYMIPVRLDGVFNLSAPRELFVFPDYYKHIECIYDSNWKQVIPSYITQYQLDFQGYHHRLNGQNWDEIQKKTTQMLGHQQWKQFKCDS
jgi:hypothetical protein